MRILRPGFKVLGCKLLMLSKEELIVFWEVPVMSNNVCNFSLSWQVSPLGIVQLC